MEFKHTNLEIETDYPKLVRDKIPAIIKQNEGIDVSVKTLDDAEFLRYLGKKLAEEAAELQNCTTGQEIKNELADIAEVIGSICTLKNIAAREIETIRTEKRAKNGGFDKRILMLGKNNLKLN